MILVGQYDSPFVRRVAVALHHYGLPFERRVLSVFADFDAMLAINPLGKVPTLILDDGTPIYDSRAIIEYLDAIAPPGLRLTPEEDPSRICMLRLEAAGIGLAEKTYERGIETARKSPEARDQPWIARLERQIASVAEWLEAETPADGFLVGRALTRADLAVALALTFLREKQPLLYDAEGRPRLHAFRGRCEALPPFRAAPYSAGEAAATA